MPLQLSRCRGSEAGLGAPRSIEQLAQLLDALPKPTTLECLLASLDRPLEVFMTSSGFSAQPSPGSRSPRTFVFLGTDLVLSVVPAGPARGLLELGYRTGPGRSIKAELEFPLEGPLTAERLHERVELGASGTVCGGCHSSESPVADSFYAGAHASTLIVPDRTYEVSLERAQELREECDPSLEPRRCALLAALLDGGEIRPVDFAHVGWR